MKTVIADITTALADGEVVMATFIKLAFPLGAIALNSSAYTIDHGGTTYLGASGMGRITPVSDKPGELPGIKLELLQIDSNLIGLALDASDQVQGSLVTISTGIFNKTTHQIIDLMVDWIGYADTMVVAEDGEHGSVGLTAESKGVDLLRGNPMVYSDADQQSLVPGDLYFQYVAPQADQPVVWPTREWFHK